MKLVLVAHNVRSANNVGSLLRTADGLGIDKVYLTGYTPYPEQDNDPRLPYLRRKTGLKIHKTALGAEHFVDWEYEPNIFDLLSRLKNSGYKMVALEQTKRARPLDKFKIDGDIALIVGNEVNGLEDKVLKKVNQHIKIPMKGRKESFNVTVAAAIAMYRIRNPH